MRRLMRVDPPLGERPGINPFTQERMVFRARPERITRIDALVEGSEVALTWRWEEGGRALVRSYVERHVAKDGNEAEARLRDCIEELACEGFHDLDAPAGAASPAAPAPSTAPRGPSDVAWLAPAVTEHCRARSWFGPDVDLKTGRPPAPDSVEWRRFRFPPATEAQLAETERVLGFALPATLRAIYEDVANGGFGPGYGFVGALGGAGAYASEWDTNIAEMYRDERHVGPYLVESGVLHGEPHWFEPFFNDWPRRVLRIVEWGCGIWSCLDVRTGHVLRYEPLAERPDRESLTCEAASLAQWLRRWLAGDELFKGHSR